jgi:hypothetical protein
MDIYHSKLPLLGISILELFTGMMDGLFRYCTHDAEHEYTCGFLNCPQNSVIACIPTTLHHNDTVQDRVFFPGRLVHCYLHIYFTYLCDVNHKLIHVDGQCCSFPYSPAFAHSCASATPNAISSLSCAPRSSTPPQLCATL